MPTDPIHPPPEATDMRVLMSSTSYPADCQDWRGRFIANLAATLAERSDISLALWAPPGELPAEVAPACTPADRAWLAHLAGALGKDVWILLPFVPDWRWLLDRSDSPWYSSATLFRQQSIGDWNTPLINVKNGISERLLR